jgi:hypothetical protein
VHDGQQRRDVALEDQSVKETLRGVGERADVVVGATQITASDRKVPIIPTDTMLSNLSEPAASH